MAIEPLGSVMTIQNQAIQKAEPVRVQESSKEATTQTETVKIVDPTVAAVGNVDAKNDGSAEEQNGNQQAQNKQIKQAVEKLNKTMSNSEAIFGIHEATQRVTIKIVDKETKKVIKELPPEKTLDMIAKVWEMAGILVDERR